MQLGTLIREIEMTNKNILKPTDAEMAILRILWVRGPSTVRQVFNELAETRKTGYTTTLKLMQIMAEKGLVNRDESTRSHIYKASVSEQETRQNMLSNLRDNIFGGSAARLVLHALGNSETTPEELQEIRSLLDKLEGKQ